MATGAQAARRACGAALICIGIVALIGVATCMTMLAFLEKTASGAVRSPSSASDAPQAAAMATGAPQAPRTAQAGGANGSDAVDWDYWRAANPDIVAWLHVPGTSIDLPVVQASEPDPQFYLSHDVYGRWNPCGCVYVDASCEAGLDSPNVVVYGHNLGDGSMLGELVNYRDRNWAQAHRAIELVTAGGIRRLTVAGADTIDGAEGRKRTAFQDGDDFARYLREQLAACRTPLCSPETGAARMYTFCTCSYFDRPADERTLVYALEET